MDAADEARLLEEELKENPDDREDLLMGVAKAWRHAGNHDRVIELLTEAAKLGVEDGDCPRVPLAEVLFDLGRNDEARAQPHALRSSSPDSPEPYHQAADLMRKRGEFFEALTWFDLAVDRLDADDRAHSYITAGRRAKVTAPPDPLR